MNQVPLGGSTILKDKQAVAACRTRFKKLPMVPTRSITGNSVTSDVSTTTANEIMGSVCDHWLLIPGYCSDDRFNSKYRAMYKRMEDCVT